MLPPLHRLDGPIQFISDDDPVWDRAKVRQDTEGLNQDAKKAHAYYAYHLGETRYQLSDEVRAYFLPEHKPTIFSLRRLRRSEWLEVQRRLHNDDRPGAFDYAFRQGLVSVLNGDDVLPLSGPGSKRGSMTESDVDTFVSVFGNEASILVGAAVVTASRDLTDAEKKP